MLHKKQTRLNLELSQSSQDPPYFEPARGTFEIIFLNIIFYPLSPYLEPWVFGWTFSSSSHPPSPTPVTFQVVQ